MQKKTKKKHVVSPSNLNENGIFNEDCLEGAKKHIPDESVDLFIGDPPFGIGEKFAFKFLEQAKRILKPNGSMYIITGYNNEHHLRNAIDSLGMELIRQVVWKFPFGMNATTKYVVSHCIILYIKKSKKAKPTFNTHARFSLLYADLKKEYHRGIKRNATKLPTELIKKMIQYSSNENDVVCDFFLGNFTTAFVAKGLNRKFTGFEINPHSYNHFMPIYNKTTLQASAQKNRNAKKTKKKHVVSPSNLAAYRAVNSGLNLLPHDKKSIQRKKQKG